jgi:nuclease-like protein
MKIVGPGFKRARLASDVDGGMISSAATKEAIRQSVIRFLACIAALSMAGLALVVTHPGWWPVSLVTVGSMPLLYQLAGPRRFGGGAGVAVGAFDPLEGHGFRVWHDVIVGDRVVRHVVVGPTGVFAITRIGWPGRFRMGHDGWLRHSRKDVGGVVWEASRDAAAVKSRLREAGLRSVPVRAIVAITRARITRGSIDLGQATFMRIAEVPGHVLSSGVSLSREQVARAAAAFGGEEPSERSRPGRG